MKILHTADWHLGHRLHEQSQVQEQTLFLEYLKNYIIDNHIDVLLVSGDIFDTGTPSNQSLELYYRFLVQLNDSCCDSIIITGGNHDSPGTLNAPKDLLSALNIKVVGKATEDIADEVFSINAQGQKVIIAAVPYLRDGDIRRAVAGESFEELTDKYKAALIHHYESAALACEQINTDNAPVIAMGHLFAMGGSVSDSELNIYVGTLGHIGAADFPKYFDYVALGHLHRPQIVGDNTRIRYSGSPHILSFSEINYDKEWVVLEVDSNKITNIQGVTIPRFREFYRVVGNIENCISQFKNLVSNDYGLTPWVEIVLDENHTINTDDLKKAAENYPFEILKMTLKQERRMKGIDELIKETKSIKELKPTEVFKMRCQEIGHDLSSSPDIEDAFNEILQQVRGH